MNVLTEIMGIFGTPYFYIGLPIVLILPFLILKLFNNDGIAESKWGYRLLMNGYACLIISDFLKDKCDKEFFKYPDQLSTKFFTYQRKYYKDICKPLNNKGHQYSFHLYCLYRLLQSNYFKNNSVNEAIKKEITMAYEVVTRGMLKEFNGQLFSDSDIKAISEIFLQLAHEYPDVLSEFHDATELAIS